MAPETRLWRIGFPNLARSGIVEQGLSLYWVAASRFEFDLSLI
jgi:hypothetical protein